MDISTAADSTGPPGSIREHVYAVCLLRGLALGEKTTVAAKTLGMENEIGRIAVGYSADMVAVEENPLTNIRTLEKADWVMVRGRIVP